MYENKQVPCTIHFAGDWLESETWAELQRLSESGAPGLKEAAEKVKSAATDACAPSTVKTYMSSWRRYCDWRLRNGIKGDHTKETIALFLAVSVTSDNSSSKLNSLFFGIKYYFVINNVCNPCNDEWLHRIVEGLRRQCNNIVTKKEPLTGHAIKTIIKELAKGGKLNLYNSRSIAFIVLGYAGFLRSSELLGLSVCDIVFYDNYFTVNVARSKTDQKGTGSLVYIKKTRTVTCPYGLLQVYMQLLGSVSKEDCLFPKIVFCSKTNSYSVKDRKKAVIVF